MESRRFPPRLGYPLSHREPKESNTRVHPSELVGEFPFITGLGVLTHLEVSGQVEFTGTDEFLVNNDYIGLVPVSGFDLTSGDYVFISSVTDIDLVSTTDLTLQAHGDQYIDIQDGEMFFQSTGGAGGFFTYTGIPRPLTDNTYDFGSSTRKWKSIYAGTAVIIGATPASTGALRMTYSGTISYRNSTGTGDVVALHVDTNTSTNDLALGGSGVNNIHLQVSTGTKWLIDGTSPHHLYPWHNFPTNTNLQDIGSSTRTLRGIYVGTHITFGTANTASTGAGRFANAAVLNWRNAANTQDIGGILVDSSNKVNIGGNAAGIVLGASVTPFTASLDLGATGTSRFRRGYFIDVSAGGIDYTWPTSQSANRVLKTNGTSTLSWGQVDYSELTGAPTLTPTSAQYVTLATDATLTSERVLAVGSVLSLTDGGAGGNVTLSTVGGTFGTGDYVFPAAVQVTNLYGGASKTQFTGVWTSGTPAFMANVALAALREANGATINAGRVNGTYASPSDIANGNILGVIQFVGYLTTATNVVAPTQVRSVAGEAWTATANGGRVEVLTTPLGSTTASRRVTARFMEDGSLYLNASGTTGTGTFTAGVVVIGTDPGGSNALRVGGASLISGRSQLTGGLFVGTSDNADTALHLGTGYTHTTATSVYGCRMDTVFPATATTLGIQHLVSFRTAAASFTMVAGEAMRIDSPVFGASSLVTTYRSLHINTVNAGSVSTTAVGLDIENISGASSANYAIRTGTGLISFGDDVSTSGFVQTTKGLKLGAPLSPAQITSDQNDYEPTGFLTSSVIRINSDAARNITGLGRDGAAHHKVLINVGSFSITLKHENASSTANKRFNLKSATDFVLAAGASVILQYDSTSDRWRLIGA